MIRRTTTIGLALLCTAMLAISMGCQTSTNGRQYPSEFEQLLSADPAVTGSGDSRARRSQAQPQLKRPKIERPTAPDRPAPPKKPEDVLEEK